ELDEHSTESDETPFDEKEVDLMRSHFHRFEEIDDAGGLMSFGTFLGYCYRCREFTSEVTLKDLLGFCRSLEREGQEDGTLSVKALRNLLLNVGEPFSAEEMESFLRDFADSEEQSVDYEHFLQTVSAAEAIPVTQDSDRE
ncbi:hypothetical protein FOZ63_030847, partial [Perkinsus olseni]